MSRFESRGALIGRAISSEAAQRQDRDHFALLRERATSKESRVAFGERERLGRSRRER